MKPAVIVLDMLNDFVPGFLKCGRAQQILDPLQQLLEEARATATLVTFSNEAHLPEIDHEFEIWGEHTVTGTSGTQVISELEPEERLSSAETPLQRFLRHRSTDAAGRA